MTTVDAALGDEPLVSCLMVSRGDLFPAKIAIDCYRRQTYRTRELVIVSAAPDSEVKSLVTRLGDPSIKYIEGPPKPLGDLRNMTVAAARGSLLCTWDDDDLYGRRRVELQVRKFREAGASAIFLQRLLLWWPERRLLGITSRGQWENSMLVRRDALPPYSSLPFREDTDVARKLRLQEAVATLDEPDLYCYVVHSNNACDVSHFEQLFEQASWIYPDYDQQLIRLSAQFPLRLHAKQLHARSHAEGGEVSTRGGDARIVTSGRTYVDQDVKVDGVHFRDCSFERARFLYLGGVTPIFEDCRLSGVEVIFRGSAANTVNWIKQLKANGVPVAGL